MSATIVVEPIADGSFEPAETLALELLPGDGYDLGVATKAAIEL